MLRILSSKCKNEHKHGSLLNGKAAGAAIYPQKLCVEILKGMRDTTIEEDLEKEMEDESKTQNTINLLVTVSTHGKIKWVSEALNPRGLWPA